MNLEEIFGRSSLDFITWRYPLEAEAHGIMLFPVLWPQKNQCARFRHSTHM
jgi:hypothetical protein